MFELQISEIEEKIPLTPIPFLLIKFYYIIYALRTPMLKCDFSQLH